MKVDPGSDADRLDDDALVAAIGSGDRDALRLLLERWGPRVRAFLQRTLGSTRDAEDLTQETFVRIYGAAARYRPSGRFPAWLFRIAGNLARRELRRRKLIALVLGEPATRPEEIFASLPASGAFDPESPLRDADLAHIAPGSALRHRGGSSWRGRRSSRGRGTMSNPERRKTQSRGLCMQRREKP